MRCDFAVIVAQQKTIKSRKQNCGYVCRPKEVLKTKLRHACLLLGDTHPANFVGAILQQFFMRQNHTRFGAKRSKTLLKHKTPENHYAELQADLANLKYAPSPLVTPKLTRKM